MIKFKRDEGGNRIRLKPVAHRLVEIPHPGPQLQIGIKVQLEENGPWRRLFRLCQPHGGTHYVRVAGERILCDVDGY